MMSNRVARFSVSILTVLILMAFFPLDIAGQSILRLYPSIRAYGMGIAGTADYHEPANADFNPAALSFMDEIAVTFNRGQLVPDLASDVYTFSMGAAGGIMLIDNADYDMFFSGSLRYTQLDYGEWEATDEVGNFIGICSSKDHCINMTVAIGSTFKDLIGVGVGFSAKPISLELAPAWGTVENESSSANKVAFDLGMILKMDLFREKGFLVSPSFGISYLNLGGDIEYANRDQTVPLSKELRIGFGLCLESPSLESMDEAFEHRLPICTFSFNYDNANDLVRDDSENRRGYGVEISLFRLFFLRTGHYENKDGNVTDDTFGYGLGFEKKGIRARFDYASVPQSAGLKKVSKYGFSLGYSF
ncbi:MAG: PorV/PorQ family protein [Candidatus Krumholzibacteria bacterium]|nr:PorV/PorQ family protein [Candidatus Krumholzibacteria bacterium]